jgi:cytochrome P450
MFLLFEKTTGSLESVNIEGQRSKFATAFNLYQDYLSRRGRLGGLYWLANTPEFRRVCKTCHRCIEQTITEALEAPRSEMPQAWTKNRYLVKEAPIQEIQDKKTLRGQCLNLLLAGRDTTACLLTWTLRLLVRHPRFLEKLRAEVE